MFTAKGLERWYELLLLWQRSQVLFPALHGGSHFLASPKLSSDFHRLYTYMQTKSLHVKRMVLKMNNGYAHEAVHVICGQYSCLPTWLDFELTETHASGKVYKDISRRSNGRIRWGERPSSRVDSTSQQWPRYKEVRGKNAATCSTLVSC